jgi:hypothetical protein
MLRFTVLVAALGLAAATSAHAGGVSIGVDVGLPMASVYQSSAGPVGVISVRGGRGHGHYRGGGRGWSRGWGWGLGAGLVLAAPYYWGPPVVVAQPPTVIVESPPPLEPPAQARPEPVIYPRNGQSPQQLEADRQECNRWATTQPAALADSSVFMRAVDACMDGRGYTTR